MVESGGTMREFNTMAGRHRGVWPAVSYESHAWNSDQAILDFVSRRVATRLMDPYQSAIPAKISSQTFSFDSELANIISEATDVIARFDERMAHQPIPMPAILLRTESATSSQIENLTTSAKQLALATIAESDKRNANLVAANVAAMQSALSVNGSLTSELILEVHKSLLENSQPDITGRYRGVQVWIGGSGWSPHGADFVPPHHSRVPAAIADLILFGNRTDVPPLFKAAIAHAQFETIHPFADGNGRTGRVLVQFMMRQDRATRNTPIPLSAGLLGNVAAYFDALTAYRTGNVRPIIEQMANAAMQASWNGNLLANDIGNIRAKWQSQIRARADSTAWKLSDLLFTQPVITADWAANQLGISPRAARNNIDTLASAGVLQQIGTEHRNRAWQANEALVALDAFSARASRRGA